MRRFKDFEKMEEWLTGPDAVAGQAALQREESGDRPGSLREALDELRAIWQPSDADWDALMEIRHGPEVERLRGFASLWQFHRTGSINDRS
jgi:alkanesulfonate monooxygenase SsuD/methylene tetrahydromethanopterin reductase-like flavin-dependent oxidoreductase (luciferase family)